VTAFRDSCSSGTGGSLPDQPSSSVNESGASLVRASPVETRVAVEIPVSEAEPLFEPIALDAQLLAESHDRQTARASCLHNNSCLPKSTLVTLQLEQRPHEPREIPGATHSTTPSTAHRQTPGEENFDDEQPERAKYPGGNDHLVSLRIALCRVVRLSSIVGNRGCLSFVQCS
jgi:hypothetical protein